ncbi:MAG: cobyrinate a,c-diamide synthase [Proteobacteria bacterium]|nr:cobyrinate a,c-diamide synthase [Pseudomonadota bacterium]
MRGLILAAPASHSGKTMVTLAVMAGLKQKGVMATAGKAGPDYIDPAFHREAIGASPIKYSSVNLDPWAMDDGLLGRLMGGGSSGDDGVRIIEGAMGVCDGGDASTAHLASRLGLPIVLILDIRGQAETAAAVALGIQHALRHAYFTLADAKQACVSKPALAGVIVNRYQNRRHYALVAEALTKANIRLFGGIPQSADLAIPSRHLGLQQAGELKATGTLTSVLAKLATLATTHIDLDALVASAQPITLRPSQPAPRFPPLGQRIAVADDDAFTFAYPHILADWHEAGAEIIPFSPLADSPPDPKADAVYLPGGYPELYLPRLATNHNFLNGLRGAAKRGAWVYGECGGYMVLGTSIIDCHGTSHPMAGLLDCATSFAQPKLHLGYRRLQVLDTGKGTHNRRLPLPPHIRAHEFHYTTAVHERGTALFAAQDKNGNALNTKKSTMGLRHGTVFGSYAHIIAPWV